MFAENYVTDKPEIVIPDAPVKDYDGCIRPDRDKAARALGDKCAEALKKGLHRGL